MRKLLNYFAIPFQFCWELPQILLGFLVFASMKISRKIVKTEKEKHRFFIETLKTGVSLGWIVFWTPEGNRFKSIVNDCRKHEYGHARQSQMLGPLYLIIVGIPSLARVFYGYLYRKTTGKSWGNYFKGFPENWADKLGGLPIHGSKKP